MANFYWVAKFGSWAGPTGLGTEASPFLGAIGLRNAFTAGTIAAAGGHTITFMGEYGAVTRAEIEQDWPNTLKAITEPLTSPPWSGDSCHAKLDQGGIVFGDKRNHTSNCKDNLFVFRGSVAWHIDARGATTNAGRMRAALMIQGVGNVVVGIRVAQPDFNFIDTGRIPATGITYAAEGSYENHGVVMWGGFGCGVTDSTVWGSDSFGNIGIQLNYMMIDRPSNTNRPSFVQRNTVYGQYRGIEATANGGAVPAEAYPMKISMPAGSPLDVSYNTVFDSRWGDRATPPVINNAMFHAGHISVNALAALYADISIHHNDCSGWCQDSIECISIGVDVYANHIHDLNPGYITGTTLFNRWVASGATWVTATYATIGTGIKLGLSSYDGGVGSVGYPDDWMAEGTAGGVFLVPATWNKAYRNRVHGNVGYGVTTNGCRGALIHANELYDCSVGVNVSGHASTYGTFWISHNYLKGTLDFVRSLSLGQLATVYLYNNICDQPTGTAYTWSTYSGKGYGANNVIYGSVSDSANMTALTGTVTAAPDYTVGTGPTPGGNCAAGGALACQRRAGFSAVLFDIDGVPWNPEALPIGPRQVQ